jgi:NADH-quinone oxidoreductase subunit N
VTWGDLLPLAPLLALTAATVVVMLLAAFWRTHGVAYWFTLIGLAATFVTLFVAATADDPRVTSLLLMDDYALFYIGLIAATTAAVALLSRPYLRRLPIDPEEYYVLLLGAALGAATLVSAAHFASFFLGLEILSVSLYALIAYPVFGERYVEAGVKYLVLGGSTAAFLLFGMALTYAATGGMAPAALAPTLAGGADLDLVVVTGVVLMLVGVGFKLALVPFHMWTPDIYQGAPAPVTAYIATASKVAVMALLLRFFRPVAQDQTSALFLTFAAISVASMLAGNLLALRQDNVKRILAYSSIAHLGYILVAFLAAGSDATVAVTFYLVAYTATNLAAFGVVAALSRAEGEAEELAAYRGLGGRRPWLAAVFAVALFSLAGIPLTAGFMAKFFLVTAGASASLWVLLVVLVVGSTIGLFYYTRIIVAMYGRSPGDEPLGRAAVPAGVLLAGLTAALVWLGVYPGPLVRFIESVVSTLP